MTTVLVVVGIILLIVHISLIVDIKEFAELKGYDSSTVNHCVVLCLFLGILGYLYVIALPDMSLRAQNQEIIEELQGQKKLQESHATESGKKDTKIPPL